MHSHSNWYNMSTLYHNTFAGEKHIHVLHVPTNRREMYETESEGYKKNGWEVRGWEWTQTDVKFVQERRRSRKKLEFVGM